MIRSVRFRAIAIAAAAVLLISAASNNLRWTQLRSGDRHGTATQGQSSDGTGATGNCAKFDANGNVTDSGLPCPSGGPAGLVGFSNPGGTVTGDAADAVIESLSIPNVAVGGCIIAEAAVQGGGTNSVNSNVTFKWNLGGTLSGQDVTGGTAFAYGTFNPTTAGSAAIFLVSTITICNNSGVQNAQTAIADPLFNAGTEPWGTTFFTSSVDTSSSKTLFFSFNAANTVSMLPKGMLVRTVH